MVATCEGCFTCCSKRSSYNKIAPDEGKVLRFPQIVSSAFGFGDALSDSSAGSGLTLLTYFSWITKYTSIYSVYFWKAPFGQICLI